MPLYLQDVDLYHFLVNVIDYPVMGGNVSTDNTDNGVGERKGVRTSTDAKDWFI